MRKRRLTYPAGYKYPKGAVALLSELFEGEDKQRKTKKPEVQ